VDKNQLRIKARFYGLSFTVSNSGKRQTMTPPSNEELLKSKGVPSSLSLMSMNDLKAKKGIPYSKPHLYRLMEAGLFVKPIRLGAHRIAFVEQEVDEWIRGQMAKREVA
jgi:prophage regulatory protein